MAITTALGTVTMVAMATTTAAPRAAVIDAAVIGVAAAAADRSCGTAACTSAGMSNGNISSDATPLIGATAAAGVRVLIMGVIAAMGAMAGAMAAIERRSRTAMAASGGRPMGTDRPTISTVRRDRRWRWAMMADRTAMQAGVGIPSKLASNLGSPFTGIARYADGVPSSTAGKIYTGDFGSRSGGPGTSCPDLVPMIFRSPPKRVAATYHRP